MLATDLVLQVDVLLVGDVRVLVPPLHVVQLVTKAVHWKSTFQVEVPYININPS